MKVKVLVTLIVLGSFSMQLHAQSNLLNAKVPQEIGRLNKNQSTANNTAPLSYGYIDDRDVMWSKTIWELIDLDQRINFPFYYPTDTINLGSDRRSLFHVLKEGIKSGAIKEVYDDDYF
jgi:gliding motility associated protien GldN